MILGITEIGVAVKDLDAAVAMFTERLGASPGPVQHFEPYGMAFCMCRVGNVDFELMAPLQEDSVIGRFLARFGEGLHHVGFAVDDVQAAQGSLSKKGLEFLDPEPRRTRFLMRDFDGAEFDAEAAFAFTRPASLAGVLLELIQYPPGFKLNASTAAESAMHPKGSN